MTQESWERGLITAMVIFGVSVGTITTAILLLTLVQEATAAAQALAAAVPGGVGITVALRKGGK